MMSRRTRIILVAIGLLFICFAITALVFAWTPVERLSNQDPIAPTLFVLPPGDTP